LGERRGVYRVFVGKPLGKTRHSWKDNIKCIVRKWDMSVWDGSSWFSIGIVGRHL